MDYGHCLEMCTLAQSSDSQYRECRETCANATISEQERCIAQLESDQALLVEYIEARRALDRCARTACGEQAVIDRELAARAAIEHLVGEGANDDDEHR